MSDTVYVLFGGLPCVDPATAYKEFTRLEIPVSDWIHKANSYRCPIGPEPGIGYVLMLRKHLNQLDFNKEYDLEIGVVNGDSAVFKRMNPIKAYALLPAVQTESDGPLDDNVLYILEFNDRRGNARKVPCDLQINIISPDSDGSTPYYDSTSGYTWESAVKTIWNINGKLGNYPGLPYNPSGIPEGFQFIGVSSYDAINTLLAKLHCAISYNPISDTFSIVQLGAADLITEKVEQTRFADLIIDRQPLNSYRNKIASAVKVYFAKRHKYYGLEDSTPTSVNQWITQGWYSVKIDASKSGVIFDFDINELEPNTAEIFWDDLTAIQDENGNITNLNDLQTRAADITSAYYIAAVSGTKRLCKLYNGIIPDFIPGSQLRSVNWYVLYSPTNQLEGAFTETIRLGGFPTILAEGEDPNNVINQYTALKTIENLQPPDFVRHTYPNYFPQIQIININNGNPISVNNNNFYDGTIEWLDPETINFIQPEKVWAYMVPDEGDVLDKDSKYFGKISGTITINGETRQLYCLVAKCCKVVDLVLIENENPIHTYEEWELFNAYVVTYKKDPNLGFIQTTDKNNPVFVLLNKNRRPDLNIPYLGKVIGFYSSQPVYKITVEPTRPVSFTTGKPTSVGGQVFEGIAKLNDFDSFTSQEDVDGERIWIKYLDDASGLKLDTQDNWVFAASDVFLGTYKGFHSENGDLRPLYYIRPNVNKVEQIDPTGLIANKTYSDITDIQFDAGSFNVNKVDKHTALVKGNSIISANKFTFIGISNNNLVVPTTITPFTEYKLFNTLGTITVTGLVPPYASFPQVVTLINTSEFSINLLDQSDLSEPANLFVLPLEYNGILTLNLYDSVTLWYNSNAIIPGWYVVSTTASKDIDTDADTSCSSSLLVFQDIANLQLPITETPLTEYNLTALTGGTIIRGIFPQILSTGPQIVTLINVGTDPITIKSNDAATEAGNAIILPPTYGEAVILEQNDTITLWYNSCLTDPCWYVLSCTVDIDENTDLDTSCFSYQLLSAGISDLKLPTTSTPLTEYNLVPVYGGSYISSIVPQVLATGPQIITLINPTDQPIYILNNSAGAAGNRIQLPPTYGDSVTLKFKDTITLWYNSCLWEPAWYVLSCTVDIDSTSTSSSLATENTDSTQSIADTTKITANNDLGTSAFGRIHFSATGATNQLDWQGLRVYLAGTGYVGPEPDIEFVQGTNITLSIADSPVNKRTQVTINSTASGVTSTNDIAYLSTNYTLTASFANAGLSLILPSGGTYEVVCDVMGQGNFTSANSFIQAQLFNTTAGSVVPSTSVIFLWCGAANQIFQNGFTLRAKVTASVNTTINLQGKYQLSGGSVTTAAFNYACLRYLRLS